MKNATRIMTFAGAATLAAFATSASAHNPMTCGEFANLKGEMQRAAFNGLEPKSVVRHQMIWDYFRFDLEEDWPHLIVDDYAAAFR